MNREPSGFKGIGGDEYFSIPRKGVGKLTLGEGGMNWEPSGFNESGVDENSSITGRRGEEWHSCIHRKNVYLSISSVCVYIKVYQQTFQVTPEASKIDVPRVILPETLIFL